jgi:hypothetical protein
MVRFALFAAIVVVVPGLIRGYAVLPETTTATSIRKEEFVSTEDSISSELHFEANGLVETIRHPSSISKHPSIEKCLHRKSISGIDEKEEDSTGIAMSCPLANQSTDDSQEILPLSRLESWCLSKFDKWYSSSQSLRCPFFRRRSGDVLDFLEGFVRHHLIHADRLEIIGPPQAFCPVRPSAAQKSKGLSLEELSEILRNDWRAEAEVESTSSTEHKHKNNNKGYYLTGRLTTAVYRDDCLFLGPDPDLPLRGLRKYLGVASNLFEYKTSVATLQSLESFDAEKSYHTNNESNDETTKATTKALSPTHPPHQDTPIDSIATRAALVARWKLEAVLRLPWKPKLPELYGTTIYHTDVDGLIACHEEFWEDCSSYRAFCATFLPGLARLIWPENEHSAATALAPDRSGPGPQQSTVVEGDKAGGEPTTEPMP